MNNKKFWTMKRGQEGFTLVELIVVIAILAILGGVAVPAYSGYVKKAEKAGDMTLLAAINDAYAAACISEELDIKDLTTGTAKMPIGDDGKIDLEKIAPADLADDFAVFYKGNEEAAFQVITSLVFDTNEFMFVDPESVSSITISYAGKDITLSADDLNALKNSTYGDIGSEALLEKVEEVTNLAQLMAGKLDAVYNDEDYIAAAMLALGVDTEEEYLTKAGEIIGKLSKEKGISLEDAKKHVQANAAVLYASQYASTYGDDKLTALFDGTVKYDTIKQNLLKDGMTAEGMAQATLVYGMYTAYANSEEYGSDALKNTAPLDALKALDKDPNFIKFVNSDQGKEDMEALRGTLGVIVDSTNNNPDATEDLMINGFNNEELKGLLGDLMG